jgi:hypothetical protein
MIVEICKETKENMVSLFWNFWFAVKHFAMICGITLPLNVRRYLLWYLIIALIIVLNS